MSLGDIKLAYCMNRSLEATMRWALVVTVAMLNATPSSAQSAGGVDLSPCLTIMSDLQRLACYDSTAKGIRSPAKAEINPIATVGGWRVTTKTNPLDDTPTVTLFLTAEGANNKYNRPIAMVARCQSKVTDVFVSWGEYLGSDVFVTYRIGSGAPQAREWTISSDKMASFVPGDARKFLRELVASDKLVVQVTPYNESPRTALFNTAGLNEALVPLKAACGWT